VLVANRFLHSLYCDDVRNEVGGKTTLVGVYESELNVSATDSNNLPVSLPRLCITVTAQTTAVKPFAKLKFKLLKDAEVIQEITVPQEGLLSLVEETTDTEKGFHTLRALFVAQPFTIDSSFVLRIQAETESEELMASGLKVNFVRVNAPTLEHAADSTPGPAA
jgi:hypothetical protein